MNHFSTLFGRQRIAKAATLAVVIAGTATIALTHLPEPVDRTLPDLPAKDAASWSMPLDRYLIVNAAQENYAELLLSSKCMASRGEPRPIPWQDVDSLGADEDGLGLSSTVVLLTEKRASELGYHRAETDPLSTSLWTRFIAKPLSGVESTAFDSCLREIRRTTLPMTALDGPPQVASQRAVVLANRALGKARTDRRVVARENAWRSCMAKADVKDLPSSPALMPSPSIATKFAVGTATASVSPAEREVAMQDATCMTSSGYRKALYEAEYRLQQKVTASDLATFDAVTIDQPDYAEKVLGIIARNLPVRPHA